MKNGFTKIELIVVIFLIIIMIAFDIIIVLFLNIKTRDIAVLSDIRQIQSGLDAYLVENSEYPIALETVNLNDVYAGTEKLCADGLKKKADQCSRVIFASVPNSDLANGNIYKYQSDGKSYKIEFILNGNFKAQNLSKGINCATNNQILSQACF